MNNAPVASTAVAALWSPPSGSGTGTVYPLLSQPVGLGVWVVAMGVQSATAGSGPAPVGLLFPGFGAVAAPDQPADIDAPSLEVRVSDRGWIGEPSDSGEPNVPYPARLAEPVTLESRLPVWPDDARRLTIDAGEVRLLNGDGYFDDLAGDWTIAGQTVTVRRGPHRRPVHAASGDFVLLATYRAAGAAVGTSRLAVTLRPVGADVAVSVCATYAGTGGIDGAAALKGQYKPRLFGKKRNVEPVQIDPSLLIYQIHDGAMNGISAVRDRGVALTGAGDVADYATLAAATVTAGTYQTCLAVGCLRVGAVPSSLTVDATGDAEAATGGYNAGTATSIARKLLEGPGGVGSVDAAAFDWPGGECGLFLRGGTVVDAMDALARGVFGWWGTDTAGAYRGGRLAAPELDASPFIIQESMLGAPPEEIGPARAPWWTARVAYQTLGRVQTSEELAGSVTAANREYYGTASRYASAADGAIATAYPGATEGVEIPSVFDLEVDAQAVADDVLAMFGRPRRAFRVTMRSGAAGFCWPSLQVGAAVSLVWSRHRALVNGRPMIVVGVSSRGDATTLTLWG